MVRKAPRSSLRGLFCRNIISTPTFGGALVPGARNVFEALDSVTPFAFADGPRRFSPLVSDIKVTPGRALRCRVSHRLRPRAWPHHSFRNAGENAALRRLNLTLAHYDINGNPILQPISNQVRAIIGYRETNQKRLERFARLQLRFRSSALRRTSSRRSATMALAAVGVWVSAAGPGLGAQRE